MDAFNQELTFTTICYGQGALPRLPSVLDSALPAALFGRGTVALAIAFHVTLEESCTYSYALLSQSDFESVFIAYFCHSFHMIRLQEKCF